MNLHARRNMSAMGIATGLLVAAGGCASSHPSYEFGASVRRAQLLAPSRADALSFSTPAHIASHTEPVLLRAWVEPDARNRGLRIEWWSDAGEAGSHFVPLKGEQAPRVHVCTIRQLSAGEYVMTAVLIRADGTEVRRRITIIVSGNA
jgi:hypothetical protein